MTGTTLINQVYLQPSTGNKYSAFDISSSLVSTDGFTHIYEATLTADTITSNHCITSIVSTDTCDTSIFDDLIDKASGIYSTTQRVLGASKYIGTGGVDDVATEILEIYDQAGVNPNIKTYDDITQITSHALSICEDDGDGFYINDTVELYRMSSINTFPSDGTYSFKIKFDSFTSTTNSQFNGCIRFSVGNPLLTLNFRFNQVTNDLEAGILSSAGVFELRANLGSMSSFHSIIVTTNQDDVIIYLDGVSVLSYTETTTSVNPNVNLEISDENTIQSFWFDDLFLFEEVLTASEVLQLHNEIYA